MSLLAKRISCPVCDRDIAVTNDGRLHQHKNVGEWCHGENWVPAKRPSMCPEVDDEDFTTIWQVPTPPMWSCYRAWDEWWRDDLRRLVRVVTAVEVLYVRAEGDEQHATHPSIEDKSVEWPTDQE